MDNLKVVIESLDEIYKFQPESAVWAIPVYAENAKEKRVKDFQFVYCNPAAINISEIPAEQLVGKHLLMDAIPDTITSQMIFQQCLDALETGRPVIHSYVSPIGKYLVVYRTKMKGGVLTTARNLTEEYRNKMVYQDQSTLLASLIAHSPYGICLYECIRDHDQHIADFKLKIKNQKAADITGFEIAGSYNKTVKELISERGAGNFFEVAKKVVETGNPQFLEYYSAFRDQWIGFSFVKFADGYLLNFIDITEIKKQEREIKKTVLELDAIFNASLHGIYTAELIRDDQRRPIDLKFIRANETFYKMFENTRNILSGNFLSNFSNEEGRADILDAVDRAFSMDTVAFHTFHDKIYDRWFELSMLKLEEAVILVTVNNITEQKKTALEIETAQRLLSVANEDLKRVNNNLESFVFAASHDLQEPIRKINIYSERIEAEYGPTLNGHVRQLNDKIHESSRRMMMLVKDLLELSLVNQGITEWAEVDLNLTVRAALKDLELLIEEANPEINLTELPVITGNATQLQQMFYNLFANALKFRNEKRKLNISVSTAADTGEYFRSPAREGLYWHICVEDNGIGFSDGYAESIFKVFNRLHNKSEYGGSGIGLSIVQKVIENHGGFIKAEGEPGVGSKFHIFLAKEGG